MKSIFALLAAAGFTALGIMSVAAADSHDLGALDNVRASSARMPFYKDNQLEFYVRSQGLVLHGKLIEAAWPVIDIMRKGASVEAVARMADAAADIYPLRSTAEAVAAFWAQRTYSEGVITSENAEIDQAHRMASGKKKVFVRSPMLDLNGVGFTADFNTRIITVNSEVEIVLRNDGSRNLGSGLSMLNAKSGDSGKTNVTRAFCDVLTLDLPRNLIVLTGNVRVFDPAGSITSDRLEIEFDPKDLPRDSAPPPAGEPEKKTEKNGGLTGHSSAQLRAGRFLGHVRAVRKLAPDEKADGEQYAVADSIVYDAHADLLEMTGSRPRLARGKDFAEAERIVMMPGKKVIRFFDRCRFEFAEAGQSGQAAGAPNVITADYADWNYPENLIRLIGHTKLQAPGQNADLTADQVEIFLSDGTPGGSSAAEPASAPRLAVAKSGKRPDKILAVGNVNLARDNAGVRENARAGKLTYLAGGDRIVMENNPVLERGSDSIRGGAMTYNINEERLQVSRKSQVRLDAATVGSGGLGSMTAGTGTAAPTPVEINSESADLNYAGNKINFTGAVAARGRGMKLDCDRLDIDLADAAAGGKKPAAARSSEQFARKVPTRALCTGNVHVEDVQATLDSGVLDLRFGDRERPGEVAVEKIFAENGVKIQSRPGAAARGDSTLLGHSADGSTALEARRGELDLLNNEADFYEKVKVTDTAARLECDHLKAIARRTAAVVPTLESFRAVNEFPDRLAVGADRELVRIIGNDNVRMTRSLPSGEIQRATGDHAVYEVKDRTVVMTAKPPKRPTAITADSGMIGDKVTIELDTEEILVDNGDVLTRIGDFSF